MTRTAEGRASATYLTKSFVKSSLSPRGRRCVDLRDRGRLAARRQLEDGMVGLVRQAAKVAVDGFSGFLAVSGEDCLPVLYRDFLGEVPRDATFVTDRDVRVRSDIPHPL